MSDIGGGGAGRASNGGGARAKGPIPVQSPPAQSSRPTVIPPTEIMRRREERAKAQQERAQASSEEQRRRLQGEWAEYDDAGVAATPPPPSQRQPVAQPAQTAHRRSQSATVASTEPAQRRPAAASTYPQPAGQQTQAGAYPSSGGPVQVSPNPPPPTPPNAPPQATTRPRASTQGPRQPRPVQPSQAGPSGTQRQSQPQPSQASQAQRAAANAALSAPPPQETAETRADRERLARDLGAGKSSAGEPTTRRGDGTISSFPHAFERWEMLSSKWEGMTSHWISRLQMNSEELQNQPMLAQLSRQVTDLSAAGANLFTALVELQRLRASSERKFQRWFNDTKHDMERQQEMVGQLERAVIQERRDRADDQAHWEKQVENARRTETNFLRMNAEKDRELQIAKDESRRAWEELGRYEAVERERQKALAQGLPVEIGGYTVFPRMFNESQQGSFSTSQRRDDGRPTSRRGVQTASPVQEDPFVADSGAGDMLHDHSEAEAATPPPGRTAPASTGAYFEPGPARTLPASTHPASSYAAPGHASTAGYTSFSSPPSMQTSQGGFYSQHNAHLGYDPEDGEYETDEHGHIITDAQGRPLSYRRGLHEARSSESEGEHAAFASFGDAPTDAARRRIPATSAQAMHAVRTGTVAGAPSMQTRPEADFGFFNEDEEEVDDQDIPVQDPRYAQYGLHSPEEESQHYHPTRLSDVPEEDEASRASEAGAGRAFSGAPF